MLEWGVNFWIALPLVALFSFLIGVAIERVILRPLHNAPVLSVVVVFIGLLAIFHSLAGAIWGHTIKAIRLAVPQGHLRRLRLHRPASDRHDPRDGAAAAGAVRLLPLHAAGARHARGGAEPGLGAARRHPRRLDAGAGLGSGGGHRRGGRRAGRARRLSGAQHDGEHPALRLRRRAGRRHLESGRGGGRRLHRRRAREPDRLLRQPAGEGVRPLHHRQRREADAWR